MGIIVYSLLLWVMQDLYHQPYLGFREGLEYLGFRVSNQTPQRISKREVRACVFRVLGLVFRVWGFSV